MSNDWFDIEHYAAQKVLQMNSLNFQPMWLAAHGASCWNIELYYAYLAEWRGDDGRAIKALQDFLSCNGRDYPADTSFEEINISANPLFDVQTYAANLASWANSYAPGAWTAQSIGEYIFFEQHMSLWEHYKGPGLLNQINPSDDFNTHAYLQARVAKMNELAGSDIYTINDAIAAIQELNYNPVMDYFDYGKSNGIVVSDRIDLWDIIDPAKFHSATLINPDSISIDARPEPFSRQTSPPPFSVPSEPDIDFLSMAASVACAKDEEADNDFMAIVNTQDAPLAHGPGSDKIIFNPTDTGADTDTACAVTNASLIKPGYAELVGANLA